VEVSSNHVMDSSLDISDDKQQPQQQQQQLVSHLTSSDSRPTITDPATPSSASRRDGISSRAEYMTSPTAPPIANGLIR